MRKLILQVQTTVDGHMASPDGAMDWLASWSDDVGPYIEEITKNVDCIVLGRKLAESFIPAWESGPEREDQKSIDWMNNTPRVVITNTLTESPWRNATVANGDLTEIINDLKARPGGDLVVYGGGTLVSSLIAAGLIDDLHLFVNPTATGGGMPVFPRGSYQRLELVAARPFGCGITAMHYRPARG
jgi:dihydrofolate reductase